MGEGGGSAWARGVGSMGSLLAGRAAMIPTQPVFDSMLGARLSDDGARWLRAACEELGAGVPADRMASLLSMASRRVPRGALEPAAHEIDAAGRALGGWNPERWTTLDAVRVRLLLSHPEVGGGAFEDALEECFRFADAGELVALYRALAHLPKGERFVWRAGEGCRTNMRNVFEAVACDTPYPARYLDDVAWRQLVIKAVFIEAPLWRVHDLDRRLSPELARMALDLADERRSAGRPIQPELWLCVGPHGGARGMRAMEHEISRDDPRARRAAALALGRAGASDRLRKFAAGESDPAVQGTIESAIAGRCDQTAFAALEGRE